MLKQFSALAVAAAGFFAAAEAAASTVSLSLDLNDGAELISVEQVYPYSWNSFPSFRGVIAQSGFEIEFQITGGGLTETNLAEATEYATVSTCKGSCGESIDYLSFSRPDGAAFSLMELDVAGTTVASGTETFVAPFDNTGAPDYSKEYRHFGPTFGDDLMFSGTKADGQLVVHSASGYASASNLTDSSNFYFIFGPTTLNLGMDAGLVGLNSVTLEARRVGMRSAKEAEPHLRYLDQRGELPETLAPLLGNFSSCVASMTDPSECILNNTSFDLDGWEIGGANFDTLPYFSSFKFAVADPSHPAPIPLPGTGVLGLAAIAAFGFVARRGRRG